MLQGNENFSDVITDRGIEAMPNIEYYLARQYIREGRSEDARALIESLENNYPESLLFIRRRGKGLTWQPVSRQVSNLLNSMNK